MTSRQYIESADSTSQMPKRGCVFETPVVSYVDKQISMLNSKYFGTLQRSSVVSCRKKVKGQTSKATDCIDLNDTYHWLTDLDLHCFRRYLIWSSRLKKLSEGNIAFYNVKKKIHYNQTNVSPAGTWRSFNFALTSMQHWYDVAPTSFVRWEHSASDIIL